MNATLILSTNGNKVTLCTGFNDVPKHHVNIKRKSITKSYPKQVRGEISFRVQAKKVHRSIEKESILLHRLKILNTVLCTIDFLEILISQQKYE